MFGGAVTEAWIYPGLYELMCLSAVLYGPRQCKHKCLYADIYKVHKNKNSSSQTLHRLMHNQSGCKGTGSRQIPQYLIVSVFNYCPSLPSVPTSLPIPHTSPNVHSICSSKNDFFLYSLQLKAYPYSLVLHTLRVQGTWDPTPVTPMECRSREVRDWEYLILICSQPQAEFLAYKRWEEVKSRHWGTLPS